MLPVLLALALTVYAAVDCVQTPGQRVRGLPKTAWLAVVLLLPVAGPLAWLAAGRPEPPWAPKGRPGPGRGGVRPPGSRGPTRPPKGPDDDPDFLNRL